MNQSYICIFSGKHSYKNFLPSSCLLWNISNWIMFTFGVQRCRVDFLTMERERGDRCFSRAQSVESPGLQTVLFIGIVQWPLISQIVILNILAWRKEIRNWIDCVEKWEDFFLKGWVLFPPLKMELMWAFKGSFLHGAGEQDDFWSQMYPWFGIPSYKELPLYKWR